MVGEAAVHKRVGRVSKQELWAPSFLVLFPLSLEARGRGSQAGGRKVWGGGGGVGLHLQVCALGAQIDI